MKTRIVLAILLIALLLVFACKKKTDNLPSDEVAAEVTAFAPLPSFKEVYVALDQLKTKDISDALPAKVFTTKQEEMRNAFSLGLLTADAVLAAKGRNKTKLSDISSQMMVLTALLSLEEQVSRLSDSIKSLIEKEQWSDLDKALDQHKSEVEAKLWESENYDNYTIMLLGGWIEAANRVAWLLSQNYVADRTKVLAQKGTFNSLISNMDHISAPYMKEQEAFVQTLGLLRDVKKVLESDSNGTYSKDQLLAIIKHTDAIKDAFKK